MLLEHIDEWYLLKPFFRIEFNLSWFEKKVYNTEWILSQNICQFYHGERGFQVTRERELKYDYTFKIKK